MVGLDLAETKIKQQWRQFVSDNLDIVSFLVKCCTRAGYTFLKIFTSAKSRSESCDTVREKSWSVSEIFPVSALSGSQKIGRRGPSPGANGGAGGR